MSQKPPVDPRTRYRAIIGVIWKGKWRETKREAEEELIARGEASKSEWSDHVTYNLWCDVQAGIPGQRRNAKKGRTP